MKTQDLISLYPVVVLGAGPVGLAAAAQLAQRGLSFLVLEAADQVAANIRHWGHVKMFSPWRFNLDPVSKAFLSQQGWAMPNEEQFPLGAELVQNYLEPLAALPQIAPYLRLSHKVMSISRSDTDLLKNRHRAEQPFVVVVQTPCGVQELMASAVIDCTGTYQSPNPAGSHGLAAMGELEHQAQISYGIVNQQKDQARYANQRVLVLGAGHSAFNSLQELVALKRQYPDTQIHWAIRGANPDKILGGGANDQLKERGALGLLVGQWLQQGLISLHSEFRLRRIADSAEGLLLSSAQQTLPAIDQLVVNTGFRPDLSILSELRLALDPATQSPVALAPMIDPNEHSCGTVRPHGYLELSHPETNFYSAGIKSYGRAPTFLLLTGYEQVRSIVAALAGDMEAAQRVELKLPETGVCSTGFVVPAVASSCCATTAETAPATCADSSCGTKPKVKAACCG
ncbi:FAD-dependent oxidoreductase [Rheinheimera soli]|uniref:Flavoprotein n=1 Tax=Rheinheimera soli TaxID=443616 RepID=A0ABU1VYM8_9GAMM|nr:FAD-dependent oxidoreductase [Rheinheimera soli]MDR7120807.1 hypothetical protein [Rheinheimera soli]